MRIWITRQCASSLHAGGLERCQVWWKKPVFTHYSLDSLEVQADKIPWGINPKTGLGDFGWQNNPFTDHSQVVKSTGNVSFGQFSGYGEDTDEKHNYNYVPGLAEHVWEKLTEHFNNTSFPHGWLEEEKEGRSLVKDFILEIDLTVKFNK